MMEHNILGGMFYVKNKHDLLVCKHFIFIRTEDHQIFFVASTDEISSKGSNSILFMLLLEKLSETYHRKVSLSKPDCRRFLELLQKRSRDDEEQPLPFTIEDILQSSTVPQWCCFVKAISNNRMFMTILPESFDDLLQLNIRTTIHQESSSESDIVIDKLSESQPTEQHDDNKEQSHYFTLPFYMYECYLSNVLEMLINPWNFKLPEDIFEDLTFSESDKDESSSKIFKVPSFEREASLGNDEAYISWMKLNHERRNTECSNGEVEATLKQQCSVLTDMYYSCFVNGTYIYKGM